MPPAFGSPVKKTAIAGQERFMRNLGTYLAGANGPPLHDGVSIAFAAPDTQLLIGANGLPLHHVPRSPPQRGRRQRAATAPCAMVASAAKAPMKLVGAIKPSLHHAPRCLHGMRTQWSVPTGRRCTQAPGHRFRGMRKQLFGATGRPCTIPDTQPVGAIEPPPHIVPMF
eukprot:jgi/Tetstr1/436035/TSEL_024914.t1